MNRTYPVFAPWLRPLSRAALACYWVALFAGTHWPKLHLGNYARNTDKVLHFGAFAVLSLLLALWQSGKSTLGRREAAVILAVLMAYSLLDEVTQIPVGRTCDLFDALADWAGALFGLLVFAALRPLARKLWAR